MILLTATTDKLQLITSAAATIDVHASYVDVVTAGATTPTPGKQNTAITTATTTDILAAPAASHTINLKALTVRNKHATLACDVTVVYDANGTDFELVKVTLTPGQTLEFTDELGFYVLQGLPGMQYGYVVSDQNTSSATLADIAGLAAFVLSANRIYAFEGKLFRQSNATTVGIHHGVNFTGTTTNLMAGEAINPVTAPTAAGSAVAFGTATAVATKFLATTAGPGAANVLIPISGTIEVGASGGTFSYQHASETATQSTTKRGSWARVVLIG